MAYKKGGPSTRLLTEVELELMTQIWQAGPVTVKDVIASLPKERDLAYTSVASMMKILEQKGFLLCRKDGHAHTYEPKISKEEYERDCLDHMVTNVFGGEPVALIQRLLDAKGLSAENLRALEATLKRLSGKKGKTP